jgi:glycosyltransferase involved in cell wall biosynthesis
MSRAPSRPTVFATNPNDDLYGASRMFLESVEGMLETGWRVVVSIPERAGALAQAIEAAGGESRSVPNPVLRKTYLNPRGLFRLLGDTLRAIPADIRVLRAVRPDVIYVNTITQPLWLLLGRCLRIPVVCHVHEAEASASRIGRKVLALPLVLARRLIINSRFSQSVAIGVVPSVEPRCVVIPNGVAGPPAVEPPRAQLTAPVRLLYVGRLSDRKGPDDAITAVALLRERGVDAHLDIVGAVFTGREAVEQQLRAHVERDKLGDRVRFLGFDPNVWPHLAASDMLIVPSRIDEPFGNTAVEGLLAARPVIASRISGLLEATDGFDAAVTVAPSSPAEIADAVERIVQEWEEFRSVAMADAPRAADRHSQAKYRSGVAQVIGALMPSNLAVS